MNYTIRPNTTGAAWGQIEDLKDVPDSVLQVRSSGRAKMVGPAAAEEVEVWIKRMQWEPYDAPVFLERLE